MCVIALERKQNGEMKVEDFFELIENDPDHRYEYIDGDVYMMTGGKRRHAMIGSNLCELSGALLKDRPCMVFNSDA